MNQKENPIERPIEYQRAHQREYQTWTYCAAMTALIMVMALIPPLALPVLPVPITVQSLGVMLAGSLLGGKRAAISVLFFLLLLALGLPVLSGLVGGFGMLLTPSGGFLLAWPLAACVIGLLTERYWAQYNLLLAVLFNFWGGIVIVYAVGIPWMAMMAKLSLLQAGYLSLAFLPGDFLKVAVASSIAITFKKYYPLIR